MIVAVDTCVFIAILQGESTSEKWLDLLVNLQGQGASLVVSDIAYAEVAAFYDDEQALRDDLDDLGVRFDSLRSVAAFAAGRLHLQHQNLRRANGQEPRRVLPDFLIGCHAMHQANGLASADDGFDRSYFGGMALFRPD